MRNQYVSIAIFLMFHCVLYSQNKDSYREMNWRVFHTAKIADQIDVHSETWKNLSMQEKNDLFQIPTDELEKMTTMDLLNAYEDCAFARDRFLFSDMDQYFDYVYKLFNGTRELLNRSDLVESIIEYYYKMDPQDFTLSSTGWPKPLQMTHIEYLIGHPRLIEKYNTIQVRKLIFRLLVKYEQKNSGHLKEQKYGDLISSNIYAISRLIDRINSNELEGLNGIEHLWRVGKIPDNCDVMQLIDKSRKYSLQ